MQSFGDLFQYFASVRGLLSLFFRSIISSLRSSKAEGRLSGHFDRRESTLTTAPTYHEVQGLPFPPLFKVDPTRPGSPLISLCSTRPTEILVTDTVLRPKDPHHH